MIESASYVVEWKKITFSLRTEGVINLIDDLKKTDYPNTSLSQEMTRIRQQIKPTDDPLAETKNCVTKFEQERSKLVSQAASFADVVSMPNPTSKVLQTQSSAERL